MSSVPASLFCRVVQTADRPQLCLLDETVTLLGTTSTLRFDRTIRYCTGWHELASGASHPCPDQATTDQRYDTCPACQRRTGFNPAFYHTTTISPQQQARNDQPHLLYLAYMGPGYIKVGISWAQRGNARLLEQGALAYIVLDTFPSALIARHYEAKLAAHQAFHETTTTKQKLHLLEQPYDEADAFQALNQARHQAAELLAVPFATTPPASLIEHYFYAKDDFTPSQPLHLLDGSVTSGHHIGLVGDSLITRHNDRLVALALKKFYGYPLVIEPTVHPLQLPAAQLGLF